MAHDLDIRSFLRRAPRDWLQKYFVNLDVLQDFDWASIGVKNIEPLYGAWVALPEDTRLRTGEDFNNFALLGTPVGKVAIIDEAQFHLDPESVAPALATLEDPISCAFWTYFERRDLWDGAIFFSAADLKQKRYWRHRLNLPTLGRETTRDDGTKLEAEVSRVFLQREGRGAYCRVHQYRRRGMEYYFAYPQDHRATSNEYDEKGQWTVRPYNPAFEIIFIHDDAHQKLSIWHQGRKDRVKDLQVAFAKAVLGHENLPESQRDDRVYELEGLLDPSFDFRPSPELGIASVELRKIGLRVQGGEPHTITIELGDKTPAHVLRQRLDTATVGIPQSLLKVARVGMRVAFEPDSSEKQRKPRSFELVWPNSCSLQNDAHGVLIQRMLADLGIEPRRPTGETSDGNQGG